VARKKSYTEEQLRKAVKNSISFLQVARILGLKYGGGSQDSLKRDVQRLGLDTSHFLGKGFRKGSKKAVWKYDLDAILAKGSKFQSSKLRKKLLNDGIKQHRCEICGNTEWMSKSIPLQLHHKDGDATNNELSNLILLCPNCHALTPNYSSRK
jgi:hypothetical protein